MSEPRLGKISLTEIDGLYYPTTAQDAHAMYSLGGLETKHGLVYMREELNELERLLSGQDHELHAKAARPTRCAKCRGEITARQSYSLAKDGAAFHSRCWNNV